MVGIILIILYAIVPNPIGSHSVNLILFSSALSSMGMYVNSLHFDISTVDIYVNLLQLEGALANPPPPRGLDI